MASRPPGFFAFSDLGLWSVVSHVPMHYTTTLGHHMTLLNKIFTTRTLLQIIFVLAAMVVVSVQVSVASTQGSAVRWRKSPSWLGSLAAIATA